MKSMLLYLEDDVHKILKEYAENKRLSMATLVNDILRESFCNDKIKAQNDNPNLKKINE